MRRPLLGIGATALLISLIWLFNQLGSWLVVEDPLAPAEAIFVLAGDPPFRAIEGARLYKEGWARAVWLADEAPRLSDRAFAKMGIDRPGEREFNRAALIHLGVPESAIHTLDTPVWNTYDEVTAATRHLARSGGDTLIIATSQYHTRRVKALWRALAQPNQKLIVRPAWQNGFRPGAWWRHSSGWLAVAREVGGICNISLGFPLRPSEDAVLLR